jgi:hypothetical protein
LARSSEVGLQDALQALSRALDQAWLYAEQQGLHFVVEPDELTVHVAPLRHASSEIEWRVLPVDEQTSRLGFAHKLTVRFVAQSARGKPEGAEDATRGS